MVTRRLTVHQHRCQYYLPHAEHAKRARHVKGQVVGVDALHSTRRLNAIGGNVRGHLRRGKWKSEESGERSKRQWQQTAGSDVQADDTGYGRAGYGGLPVRAKERRAEWPKQHIKTKTGITTQKGTSGSSCPHIDSSSWRKHPTNCLCSLQGVGERCMPRSREPLRVHKAH